MSRAQTADFIFNRDILIRMICYVKALFRTVPEFHPELGLLSCLLQGSPVSPHLQITRQRVDCLSSILDVKGSVNVCVDIQSVFPPLIRPSEGPEIRSLTQGEDIFRTSSCENREIK